MARRARAEAELAQAAGQVGRGGAHTGDGQHHTNQSSQAIGPVVCSVHAVWCDSGEVPVSCEVGLPAGGAEVGEAGPGEEEEQQQHGGQGCCLPSQSRLVTPHVSPTLATVLPPSCSLLATKF